MRKVDQIEDSSINTETRGRPMKANGVTKCFFMKPNGDFIGLVYKTWWLTGCAL